MGGQPFLYLFDGKNANYFQDGIDWDAKKQSAKYILYNELTKNFKLKNARSDTGKPVMRRATFKSSSRGGVVAWVKHEYKLLELETSFETSEDGTITASEKLKLLDFPVLVHYFCKKMRFRTIYKNYFNQINMCGKNSSRVSTPTESPVAPEIKFEVHQSEESFSQTKRKFSDLFNFSVPQTPHNKMPRFETQQEEVEEWKTVLISPSVHSLFVQAENNDNDTDNEEEEDMWSDFFKPSEDNLSSF